MITLLNNDKWDSKELVDKMHDDDFYYNYLGKNALSSSSLKKLLESPKAYWQSLQESDDNQNFRDGRLIHMMILEPDKAEELEIVSGTKATKAYKTAVEELGSHKVYTSSEFNNAKRVVDALMSNDEARFYLEGMEFEVPNIGVIDDIPFRAKADCISKDWSTIVDLKTTSSISSWEWSAKNFKYNMQAELYKRIFGAEEFFFLVVDKNTLDIGVYEVSDDAYKSGWNDILMGIYEYKQWEHVFKSNNPEELFKKHVIRGVL